MPNLPITTRVQTALQVLRGIENTLPAPETSLLAADNTASQRGWTSYPLFPNAGGLYLDSGTAGASTFTNDDNSFAQAYIAVSAVRVCVDTYAWAAGQVPRKIIRNSTYDRTNDEDLALSEDVKPRHIWFEAERWHQRNLNNGLITAMIYNTMLTDATYVLKRKSQFNSSPRLQVLNSQGMQVEDYTGYITQFRYNSQGEYTVYKPEEIAYNHGFNPFYDTRGASLVSSIIQEINIDRNLNTFLQAFFKNDAMPGMVISPNDGQMFGDMEYDALVELLRQNHKGVGNRRRAMLSRRGVNVDVLPEPDIEKQDALREPINQLIFQAFGVPRVLTGDNTSTPYKDADNVMANFINMRVKPLLLDLQAFINEGCLPFLDSSKDTRFEFDFSAMATETEADSIKMQNATSGYAGGIWTLNEAREHTGKPTYANGDQLASGITVEELDTAPVSAPALPTGAPVALLPQTTTPLEADRDTDRSLTMMLGFANDPNLLILQRQVKEFCKDYKVTWNEPGSYHTTIVHLPNVTDGQLARVVGWIQGLDLPDIALKVGSLNRFEGVGNYALHFRIRQNTDLTTWQTGMVEWLESQGIVVSPYSQPENYIPHITMGYAEDKPPRWTFDSKLSIQPQTLQLSYNGEIITERQWTEDNRSTVEHSHEHAIRVWELNDPDTLHKKQLAELEQWRKHTWTQYQRHGGIARPFVPKWLAGEKADAIQAVLKETTSWEALAGAFNRFLEQFSQRDIQATRLQFEDAFDRAITAALEGNMNRRQWGIEMRRIVLRGINAAYRDGLKAGGVDSDPDEAEQDTIEELAANQREYINALAARVFKDEAVTPAMAEQKAAMWWIGSIQPAYYAGFESAARNQMVEFTGDDGEESCKDCRRLKGQRHRLKDVRRRHFIPGEHRESFECGNWNCSHSWTPVEGQARGNW